MKVYDVVIGALDPATEEYLETRDPRWGNYRRREDADRVSDMLAYRGRVRVCDTWVEERRVYFHPEMWGAASSGKRLNWSELLAEVRGY